ncbi:MAG: protein TolQ, partial [Rhizobium sp.]
MTANMSLAHLISQASVLAQVVLLLLVAASITSWAVIFAKRKMFNTARDEAVRFEDRFWSGGNLADLHQSVVKNKEARGLPAIFTAGYEEYVRQQQSSGEADDALAAVQRQMRVAKLREVEHLEGGLALLATIGSTSPYVGLFGTVWG